MGNVTRAALIPTGYQPAPKHRNGSGSSAAASASASAYAVSHRRRAAGELVAHQGGGATI